MSSPFRRINGNFNGKISKVATIYGKKNLADYPTRNGSQILALHKIKANQLFANIGFQLPKSVIDTAVCYDDSIAYTDKNVKPLSEVLTEISQAKVHDIRGEK